MDLQLELIDTVHCLDWRALCDLLPNASVDMILTDMPYGTTACEWDTRPDLDEWWRHARRVTKPRGAIVCTASQPFTSELVMSWRDGFRYEWIWEKTLPMGYLNANRTPLKKHENVLVFYAEAGSYQPQFSEGKPYRATSGAVGGVVRDKTVGGWVTENNGRRYPTSVIHFNSALETIHPTQKPVALFEYLIRTYTQPGDLVFDPFVGSGTTALAARATGRHYICGDLSSEYVTTAHDRLRLPFEPRMVRGNDDVSDLPLFAPQTES
jgi:site-specific DNA-methyltransferase (adenine-specific)